MPSRGGGTSRATSRGASSAARSTTLESEGNIQHASESADKTLDNASEAESTVRNDIGRTMLKIYKQTLLPSNKISSVITASFKKLNNPSGYTWQLVPEKLRDSYYEEFKKSYYWDPNLEANVYRLWFKRAGKRYSSLISRVKAKRKDPTKGKPAWIPDNSWQGWMEYWEREDVKEKAKKARLCRLSKPDGPGTGYSRHRGGSKCSLEYAIEISKEKGITVEEAAPDVFDIYHKSKDGGYTNGKARRIAMRMEQKLQELSQPLPGTSDVLPFKRSQVYLDASGGLNNKKRIFAAAYLVHSLGDSVDGGSTSMNSAAVNEQLTELQVQLDTERRVRQKLEEAQAAQKEVIETERRERQRLEEAQAAQQQLMEKMMSQMLAQQEALNALMSKSGSAPTPP